MKNDHGYKIFILLITLLIGAASAAEVAIVPYNKTVTRGETFDLNVTIDPEGAAIAGAQLNIEFNSSILYVNDIKEGELFKKKGISTSFSKGTVNNSLGTVMNVYSAILGPYNISAPGIFILINATATGIGESQINLSNVKISDPEGKYVALNVSNGSVNIKEIISDRTPPSSVENLKNISYEAGYINWTWTDPEDEDFAKVMIYLDGIYQKDVLKGVRYYNASLAPGTHTIGTRTMDINGNVNSSIVTHTATTLLPDGRFINGKVLDSVTNKGIAGVMITAGTGISTTTDGSGSYSLFVKDGTYNLTGTSDPEYYPNSITVTTSYSAAVAQDIQLVKKPVGTISGSIKIS